MPFLPVIALAALLGGARWSPGCGMQSCAHAVCVGASVAAGVDDSVACASGATVVSMTSAVGNVKLLQGVSSQGSVVDELVSQGSVVVDGLDGSVSVLLLLPLLLDDNTAVAATQTVTSIVVVSTSTLPAGQSSRSCTDEPVARGTLLLLWNPGVMPAILPRPYLARHCRPVSTPSAPKANWTQSHLVMAMPGRSLDGSTPQASNRSERQEAHRE